MFGFSWGEVLIILVVALMVFGPRRLPELAKSLGQAMGQFKRASEEFKRSWEEEVESEKEREKAKASAAQTPSPSVEPVSEPAHTVPAEPKEVENWM
ncbi:MAG TPA: twin-arginine translocase TatA/TatE family subunit [Blastocatellia bacterium]|nr:twin-arginine translocase TatA/TatE family subunit [Blastocatellia bacterium]